MRRLGTIVITTILLATLAAVPADAAAPGGEHGWIVTLKGGLDPSREAPGLLKPHGAKASHLFRHALNGFSFNGSAAAAAALRRNNKVRTVVEDHAVSIAAETVTPGIKRIRARHPTAPDAQEAGFSGAGVRVAIIDTGIDLTHPDLAGNIDAALGKNCYSSGPPQDGHGHGTHVAGITAAIADNGIGVVGSPRRHVSSPIKVLSDTGTGEWSNVICGIDHLTALATDSDPTNDVRVANMSLGDVGPLGTCTDGGLRQAICTSTAAGILYVAAAGNSAADTSTFIPAAFPEVVAVSAMVDFDGEPGGAAGCRSSSCSSTTTATTRSASSATTVRPST